MAKTKGQTLSEFKDAVDPPERVRHLERELGVAQAELDAYKEEHGALQVFFDRIKAAVVKLPAQAIDYQPPRKKTAVGTPVEAVWNATDWHNGAVQDADEIEGFNEFGPEILSTRILGFCREFVEWVDLHRLAYTINTLRIIATGDFISGDIHDEQRVTNAYPIPVQAVMAGRLLSDAIQYMAQHFSQVVVDFVTVDNHGRLTRKPQKKEGGFNTMNYVVGAIAEDRLANQRNVGFTMHPRSTSTISVANRRYLICHGHEVRGWAGFPYYGLQRKVGREAVKRMRRQIGQFDRVILGHWHAPMKHPWYWIGGSASGTDAHDHSEGRESEPCQSCWLVHPGHGEFDCIDFKLRT